MRTLEEALRRTLDRLGIRDEVARAEAVRAWPRVASVVLGDAASRTRALRVDGDTLVVSVASPVLAQELRLRAADLVSALAAAAPASGVRALRFVPGAGR